MTASTTDLEHGRESSARSAWAEARESLSSADRTEPLGADDLYLLATSAYMTGHLSEHIKCLQRAHETYLDEGDKRAAVRCAFWIGINLARQGEPAQAGGWIGRGKRLLEGEGDDGPEGGYLLMPEVFELEAKGDLDAAAAISAEAAGIGDRFGDADLFALATQTCGRILVRAGRVQEGLQLLDEAMVEVVREKLSPIASGIVYCSVILACRQAYETSRASEWTTALAGWCDSQPEMVAFTGRCRLHRAEIMQLRGDWDESLDEAASAYERSLAGENPDAAAESSYQRGEIHRLRGDFEAAGDAYREASRRGREPQPGLAQLRLAQGETGIALSGIRRSLVETDEPSGLLALLPAAVEVMLAAGKVDEAELACSQLEDVAADRLTPMLEATVRRARGAVLLAGGDSSAALVPLRRSWELWRQIEAPHEAARARILVGMACRSMGDEEAAMLELEAARVDCERLGAATDLKIIGELGHSARTVDDHDLSPRELEVLRLVAAGEKNRQIASELGISEHTVARHVQNIFAKLGVSSRTAASAWAFERKLV